MEEKISEKKFEEEFKKIQKIDLNHYTKKLENKELKKYIDEYKNKKIEEKQYKSVQILTPGNPEVVFKTCLELLRDNIDITINIEDFCLAQNTYLIEVLNYVLYEKNIDKKIILNNMLSDKNIIENSKKVEKTICIGNSSLYNRLEDKIEKLEFNPFMILEVFSDSEEYEELRYSIYEYSVQNQYELEFYDDLEFEDAIKSINKNGYGFCSLLLTKDKLKAEIFKKNINSKYIIINENPFKKIDFSL